MEYARTLEEEQFVLELQKIKENNFIPLNGQDPFGVVLRIIDHLGSTDPILRDELGYTVLSRWIYKNKFFQPQQLRDLLFRLISKQMLFYCVGEKQTDSVFMRSFSSLVIALILLRDNVDHFLSQEDFDRVFNVVCQYCKEEIDFRGYVIEGGWAHAAAHIADVLKVCAESRYVNKNGCFKITQCIQDIIENAKDVFCAEEDERLARSIISMFEKDKVSLDEICDWLEQQKLDMEYHSYLDKMIHRMNWKQFVRSLFFQLQKSNLLCRDGEKRLLKVQQSMAVY